MRQLSFHADGKTMTPPPLSTLAKATITRTRQKLLLTGFCACEQPPTGADLCHQLQGAPFSSQWQLQVQLEGSQQAFSNQLSEGLGYAVSSGSFKAESGAAMWLIEGTNSATRLTGNWHTPGASSDHSSFQSEVAGILGVLYTLTYFTPTTQTPPFCLACNSLSVVNHLQNPRPIDPTKPHADLLIAAKTLLHNSQYRINLVFVRDHQDTGHPMVLARDAWLNIEADLIAKEMVSLPFVTPPFYKLPGNPWGCYMEKRQIVIQLDLELWQYINGNETL